MLHRASAAALTVLLSLSSVPAAYALTSNEILDEQKAIKGDELCSNKSGDQQGKCISDVLKRIKQLRDDFADALKEERVQWYFANTALGGGEEYAAALAQYTKDAQVKRQLFNAQQREIEKMFFSRQKIVRGSGMTSSSSSSSAYSRKVTSGDMTAAKDKCAKVKDEEGQRICLRTQLRLIDPKSKKMGGAVRQLQQ